MMLIMGIVGYAGWMLYQGESALPWIHDVATLNASTAQARASFLTQILCPTGHGLVALHTAQGCPCGNVQYRRGDNPSEIGGQGCR